MAEKRSEKNPEARKLVRTKRTSRRAAAKPAPPEHDEVAVRAYYIGEASGSDDHVGNWLKAEAELLAS